MPEYKHKVPEKRLLSGKRAGIAYFLIAWHIFGYAAYRMFSKPVEKEIEEMEANSESKGFGIGKYHSIYMAMMSRPSTKIKVYSNEGTSEPIQLSEYLRKTDPNFDVTKIPK